MDETKLQRASRRLIEYFGLDAIAYSHERRAALQTAEEDIESLKREVAELREELARVTDRLGLGDVA